MDEKQQFARKLIERRDGLPFPGLTGRNIVGIALNTVLAVWIMLSAQTFFAMICAWAFGMFIGATVVNLIWQRIVKSRWPIMRDLIDWSMVKTAATGVDEAHEGTSETS